MPRTYIRYNHQKHKEMGINLDTPEGAFFVKVSIKLLIDRSLDIEENEGTSDIEKKSSHGEVFSWADPEGKTTWRILVQGGRAAV